MNEIMITENIAIEMSTEASFSLYEDLLGGIYPNPALEGLGSTLKKGWKWLIQKIKDLIAAWKRFLSSQFKKISHKSLYNDRLFRPFLSSVKGATRDMNTKVLTPILSPGADIGAINWDYVVADADKCRRGMRALYDNMYETLPKYLDISYYKKNNLEKVIAKSVFADALDKLLVFAETLDRRNTQADFNALPHVQRIVAMIAQCNSFMMRCVELLEYDNRGKFLSKFKIEEKNVSANTF